MNRPMTASSLYAGTTMESSGRSVTAVMVSVSAPSRRHAVSSRRTEAAPERRASAWPHILILLALGALFTWLFSRFFLRPLYLAESDLYENGLPIFLSPIWKWSSFEFSGLPVLADPANFNFYPPNMVFGELLHSWTAVVMSGPLLAACFTYAYVFSLTRSKTAAVFSALAFSLSEDMLERLRHINHVHAIAWLPLILLALDRSRARRSLGRGWIAIGAVAVGSCILAGHPQPALYVMYCAGLYALVGLIVDAGPTRRASAAPRDGGSSRRLPRCSRSDHSLGRQGAAARRSALRLSCAARA